MSLTVDLSDPVMAGDEWDGFVRQQAGATHFHLSGWHRVVREVWKHDAFYLTARDSTGALAGVLPLVKVKSALFGNFLCSMPFVSYGGPLGSADAVRSLTNRAAALAAEVGADLLELRSYQELPIDLDVSHRKVTVVLDLPPTGGEALMKSFDAKVRSQIRRPFKEGLRVEFGADQVEPIFSVLSHHMRDLGTPTHSLALFHAIANVFPDDSLFGCAWIDDTPIAAGCGFRWGGEFEMTWASSLRSHSRISPNMGLYFAFMERAMRDGASLFNFGRCTSGSGTHRFKKQWGSRDIPLWWYQLARGASKTPSPDDARYSLGPRVWRYLPVTVATALGPAIVRLIP